MTYQAELWRCEYRLSYYGQISASEPCRWSTYVEAGEKPGECPDHGTKHMQLLGDFELVGEA